MEPKNDVGANDVDAGVLATGCGWSCGLGCGLFAILLVLAVILGVSKTGNGVPGFLTFLGFLGGVICHVAIGYLTAQAARDKGVGPNIHVIILGLVLMVVSLISFVTPEGGQKAEGWIRLLGLLSWISTIPLMLFGAQLLEGEEQSQSEKEWEAKRNSTASTDKAALEGSAASLPARLRNLPPETIAELREKIRAHDLADFENRILQLAQPAIELFTREGEAKLGESRFGGTPDLPPSIAWPRDERGKRLSFLLQLNLAEMPRFGGSPLPENGMLWFFVGQNESNRDVTYSVLFHAGDETLHATSQPPSQEFCNGAFCDLIGRRLSPRLMLGAPLWYCDEWKQLRLSDAEAERYNAMQSHGPKALAVLLGGVAGIGVDPRETAFLVREADANGLSPGQTKSLAELWPMFKWRNLLRLNSDESVNLAIGNAGHLNFLIHRDDLKSWSFERLYVEIQSR